MTNVTVVTTVDGGGLIPISKIASGTPDGTKFVRDDGTLQAPTATVADGSITYAKIQDVSAASRVLGRGSAAGSGDVQELTLAGGLKMDGTAVTGELAYVPTTANTAVNSVADVTIVTHDVTGVAAGDQLVVEGHFTILNDSTATRVYAITVDFDGLFDVEISTGALAFSSTLMHPFYFRACLDVRSASLAYAVFSVEGQLAAGIASGTDTTMAATHLRGMGWGTTASDVTGTCTVALKVRSANATATQTLRLHQFSIRKMSPT